MQHYYHSTIGMKNTFRFLLINDYSYYLMMSYRYRYRAALMVLPGLISVILSICSILFIVKERLYLGRIVPTTLVYAAFAIIILISIYSKIKPEINIKYLKYGLVIALPLVLHGRFYSLYIYDVSGR